MKMPEHFIWINVKTSDYYKLVLKLRNCDINFYDSKINNNNCLLKVTKEDYEKLKKYLISYKVNKFSDTGIYKLKNIIKNKLVFIISLIIGIILLFIANNLVFKIEIVSNDKKITKIVQKSLDKYNLEVLSFKKNHFDMEKIVEKMLDDNKDYIEWLEIRYDGLKMIVEVTKKVNEDIKEDNGICNIIAKADAKIINYTLKSGEALVAINQYVYKGDVLISGIIKHNEEIKNTLCADAIVYGEVWYKVNIEVPFESEEYIDTGKSKYNFNVKINNNNYKILKSSFKKISESKEELYKLNDFKIELVKEKELKLKKVKLSEKEAFDKGIRLVTEKINLKLKDNEEILEKKVLKKIVNDSTMVLDIFVVTKEDIAKQVLVKEVDLNDKDGSEYSNE